MLTRALQQRIGTALLLAPLAVAAVLFLPTPWMALFLALVVILGAWEWAVLSGVTGTGRVAYLALTGVCMGLLWLMPGLLLYLLLAAAIWWWGLAVYLLRLRAVEHARGVELGLLALGLLVLIGPWAALVHLHRLEGGLAEGPLLVLALLLLIWLADTAAYFAGRRWGRRKLAPVLSPGKTRAGLYGGLGGACAFGAALGWALGLTAPQALSLILICTLTAFISVVGDLFESLLKRRREVKDSGRLLPGHGGVLDRIDSITAGAPVFALGVLWLGGHL